MNRFTPEEYAELLAFSRLEPVGIDRINYYLSLICLGMSGGKASFDDLMFRYIPNDVKLRQWLAANKIEVKPKESTNGLNCES